MRRVHPGALTAQRHQARLTQEELAERSGLSPRTIRSVERGQVTRPHWSTVRCLADALQMDESALAEALGLHSRYRAPVR